MVERVDPVLVALGLMLPGIDGWEVCRLLCRASDVPIPMLTARTEERARSILVNNLVKLPKKPGF